MLAGRSWRRRFGIAAPRLQVRTRLPWYLRWLVFALLFACSAALAAWIYDAGRRYAGFDRREAEEELGIARSELAKLRDEAERLRAAANAAGSKVSIERSAQQQLAQQLKGLELDNARLREELAIFESMLSGQPTAAAPLAILRFKVEPELLPGEYRYRALLLAGGARRGAREFQGRLEMLVSLTEEGRNAMIAVPDPAQAVAGASGFRLAFKRFQRVEGVFRVSPKAKLLGVQLRVYEAGAAEPRATHKLAL